MALVEVEPFTTKVVQVGDTMQVTLPKRTSPALALLILPFLTFWTIGGKLALTELWSRLQKGESDGVVSFLLCWCAAWLVSEVFGLYLFIWSLAGKRVVTLTPQVLRLQYVIGPLRRRRDFPLSEIRRLRVQPAIIKARGGMGVRASLVFDYGPKTIALGWGMNELEAIHIRRILAEHAPLLQA